VDSIKVGEAGVGGAFYAEEATCQNNGTFVWTKTFTGPLDTDKTLTLVAHDITDTAISGANDSVDVHIDNVAPAAPVITTPASTPYTYVGASTTFSIIGTVSADTHQLTGPNSSTITPTGINWTHNVTLTPGASLNFTYYAWDLAGNQSSGFTQTIDWNPSINVLASGAFPGGSVTDGGTSFSVESAIQDLPGVTTGGASSFTLETGFNYVTNSARQ